MTYLRVGKFEEVVKVWETDQTVPLENCAVVEVKSETERGHSQTLSLIGNQSSVSGKESPACDNSDQSGSRTHTSGDWLAPTIAPKKNTSHGNEVLAQITTHLRQRPCYQRVSP